MHCNFGLNHNLGHKVYAKKRMSNKNIKFYATHSPLSPAVWTGLEPATPCVTGRYSNQLNYHTVF